MLPLNSYEVILVDASMLPYYENDLLQLLWQYEVVDYR